jgi:hypothetical protein
VADSEIDLYNTNKVVPKSTKKERYRDPDKGGFVKGHKGAAPGRKGSRNRLTMKLLERFEMRNLDGISIEELMFDIAQGNSYDMELRFKAAAKLSDLIFPKTAQVELDIEDGSNVSLAEMDERIDQLLKQEALRSSEDDEDNKKREEFE